MSDKYSSPVPKGCRFTSGFMTKARPDHAGSDWAPPKPGQTGVKIHAVSDGVVEDTGYSDVLPRHTGRAILLDHGMRTGNGSTDRMETYYGHLAEILVSKGQKVKAGEVIAIMGTTGNSRGIHLHLGVLCNGKFIDPKTWLRTKRITPGSTKPLNPQTGSKSIKDWQLSMNKVFPSYANFAGDGKYGPYSESVTREFQGRVGIKVTGKLDATTKTKMRSYGVKI